MDKTMKIYIGILLGVIALVIFIDMSRTKPVDWSPTYKLDGKNPLDLYVFSNEVEKLFPDNKLTKVKVTPFEYFREHPENMTIMLINMSVYDVLDSVMLQKIAAGSNLFISAENLKRTFTDTLKISYTDVDPELSLKTLDSVRLTLTSNVWKKDEMFVHPVTNSYAYLGLDKTTTTVLGKMQLPDEIEYPSFIKVKFGKGFIFLHNQPMVFSNFMLLNERNTATYVSRLLSFLPKDKPVAWITYQQGGDSVEEEPNSLSVIFRYPALRATWLLFIYGLLLYVLFNAKRRQRVVPVIKPLKNTTVEFVQTIGNLYFQEGSATNLMDKKIIYFLDRIRSRYYLDTAVLDDKFAEKLQLKSGKDTYLIREIVQLIRDFRKLKSAAQSDLIRLSNLIEEFWNN